LLIDCDTCAVRGDACGDCVVTVLLGGPPGAMLDPDEQRAIGVLAASGLVPPLRLVPAASGAGGGAGGVTQSDNSAQPRGDDMKSAG
jgi:hypothetical protein